MAGKTVRRKALIQISFFLPPCRLTGKKRWSGRRWDGKRNSNLFFSYRLAALPAKNDGREDGETESANSNLFFLTALPTYQQKTMAGKTVRRKALIQISFFLPPCRLTGKK